MRKKILWKDGESSILQALSQNGDNYDIDNEEESELPPDIGTIIPLIGGEIHILQTNFRIKENVLKTISNIDGIENLKVISQYQLLFVLSNSGFFSSGEIKKNVEYVLLAEDGDAKAKDDLLVQILFGDTVLKSFIEIRDGLYSSKDKWILYIYPNGHFEIIADIKQFDEYINKINTIKFLIGGFATSSLAYA